MSWKWLLALALAGFVGLAALVLRPVPVLPESELEVVSGTVVRVFEGGENDVNLVLAGDARRFYINRGLEQGLEVRQLQDELVGREVTIKYPPYWTPLDPNGSIRHLSKLEVGEVVLFDETPKG